MNLRHAILILLALTVTLPAQRRRTIIRRSEAAVHRVRFEASAKPGEFFRAIHGLIPAGVKQLRGVVVHQHGCGEGSCESGQTGASALAGARQETRLRPAGLIRATAKGRLPNVVRSAQRLPGFQEALVELGNAELATVGSATAAADRPAAW